jgi:hypothetical protein
MLLSSRAIPSIFLISIPSFIGLCYFLYGYYLQTFSNGHPFLLVLLLQSASASYAIIIAYGLYPIILSTEKYTKRRNENIVVEFEFIKKLVFTAMPILIVLVLADRFQVLSYYSLLYDFFLAIFASSIAVVVGAMLRIATQVIKKEYRLYLAKGYCMIASTKEKDLDKMKYLFLSLDSYNKYLLRNIKSGIRNINKIYSLIICKNEDEMINSICKYLAGDRLGLARYLVSLYEVPPIQEFFIKESFVQKLKTAGAFLVAAIPIVIAIIQLFIGKQ